MKIVVPLILVVASLLAHAQKSQPTGDIRGIVVDQNGSPIAAATVYAVPQGLIFDDITPRSAKTDRNGAFDFHGGFELAAYKLYSRKLKDAYPDPLDTFYGDSNAKAPTVELTEDCISATVTVKLGKQAAVIAGRIVDAGTGDAVKAMLGVVDTEGHGHSVSVDGNYRILVPSGKDVTLMVTVLGRSSDRSIVPFAPLRLEPGQYVYLEIPISR